MKIVNGFRTGSQGQPIRLSDNDKRVKVARAACDAVKAAGANRVVQLAAGDAAFAGKSHREIETQILSAGGNLAHFEAAINVNDFNLEKIVMIESDNWQPVNSITIF